MSAHIQAHDLTGITGWQKSTRSGAAGHCVEVAPIAGGIAIRNSNDPGAGALAFTTAEWAAFRGGIQDGEFDQLG